MLTRRQELNTQLQQLIDAFLLALSLWIAYVLRLYSTFWFGLSRSVDPQSNYAWLFIPIMMFGPIFLELQGFYESPLNKTLWKSVVQVIRAMIGLSIVVSACVIFVRLPLGNRTVPLLFIGIGSVARRTAGTDFARWQTWGFGCSRAFFYAGTTPVDSGGRADRHRSSADFR